VRMSDRVYGEGCRRDERRRRHVLRRRRHGHCGRISPAHPSECHQRRQDVHRYGVATKFAVTPIRTSTGVQFRTVGLNSHWRTASTAALARSGSPDETWTSRTVPSVPMSTSRSTTPPTFAAWRFSGYRGLTCVILDGARMLPPTPLAAAAAPFPPQRSA